MSQGMLQSAYMSALISFAVLAKYQNMPKAVKYLGVSRQTIGRHMDYLDERLGGPVIQSSGRLYETTDIGKLIIGSADNLLRQIEAMTVTDGLISLSNEGLEFVSLSSASGKYRGQQHPLWRVHKDAPESIKRTLHAWNTSKYDGLSPAIVEKMPYMLTFRRTNGGWVCSHVGEKSAYAEWFGWEWAKSAIGSYAKDAVSGEDYFRFCSTGYMDVMNSGSCRLDHHDIIGDLKGDGVRRSIKYQRLTMSLLLPNKTPIIATMVCVTDEVDLPQIFLPRSGKFKP